MQHTSLRNCIEGPEREDSVRFLPYLQPIPLHILALSGYFLSTEPGTVPEYQQGWPKIPPTPKNPVYSVLGIGSSPVEGLGERHSWAPACPSPQPGHVCAILTAHSIPRLLAFICPCLPTSHQTTYLRSPSIPEGSCPIFLTTCSFIGQCY